MSYTSELLYGFNLHLIIKDLICTLHSQQLEVTNRELQKQIIDTYNLQLIPLEKKSLRKRINESTRRFEKAGQLKVEYGYNEKKVLYKILTPNFTPCTQN